MSKYDQLDYLTFAEKNNKIPRCIKNLQYDDIEIPEELIGTTVENLKQHLKIENEEQENNFLFANKNQTIINSNYFKNGKFFSQKMANDEKKEFLLDYLNYNFGNQVNGQYFEQNLQDIFNLRHYELIDEDFDLMISEYLKSKENNINNEEDFQKHEFDLNDPEDRKKFKQIIFANSIKFMKKEDMKQMEIPEENSLSELRKAIAYYAEKSGRRVTLEAALLHNKNTDQASAQNMINFARGIDVNINLIPWNPVSTLPFEEPSNNEVKRFVESLEKAGLNVTLRTKRGRKIGGACGQLGRTNR